MTRFCKAIQGVPSARGLGRADLNFECSTVCPILPGLMGIWQKRLGKMVEHPNQSQPNPGLRAHGDTLSARKMSVSADLLSNQPNLLHLVVWGHPYMTSAKFSGFLTPPPPSVTYRNQLILLLLSAFWGPPLPHPDVIYGSPLTKRTD